MSGLVTVCADCSARFGGWFTFRRHRPVTWMRCRTPQEMRAIGLHRNRRHVWVRRRPTFQTQLDFRTGSRVRSWFGKPWSALSPQEEREYRKRLLGDPGGSDGHAGRSADPRNAGRASQ